MEEASKERGRKRLDVGIAEKDEGGDCSGRWFGEIRFGTGVDVGIKGLKEVEVTGVTSFEVDEGRVGIIGREVWGAGSARIKSGGKGPGASSISESQMFKVFSYKRDGNGGLSTSIEDGWGQAIGGSGGVGGSCGLEAGSETVEFGERRVVIAGGGCCKVVSEESLLVFLGEDVDLPLTRVHS